MGSGDLTFTPKADANGSATVTVTLTDNGGGDDTSVTTLLITVTAVNDAPSFTKGSDQSILEDAGAQAISNWAADIILAAAAMKADRRCSLSYPPITPVYSRFSPPSARTER